METAILTECLVSVLRKTVNSGAGKTISKLIIEKQIEIL